MKTPLHLSIRVGLSPESGISGQLSQTSQGIITARGEEWQDGGAQLEE